MITDQMKHQVESRVKADIATLNRKYNVMIPFPTISYDLRGRAAGQALYREWCIRISAVLLVENFHAMLNDTVPHELCHLATKLIYPHALSRENGGKRSPHGAEWTELMRAVGVNPARLHKYDTTNSRVRPRVRYKYSCSKCGHLLNVGPKHHAKMQSGIPLYHKTCIGHVLVWVENDIKTAAQSSNQTPSVVAKKAVKQPNTSKLSRCEGWYQYYKTEYPDTFDRATVIGVFINEVDCTPAGANTYFAICKKKYG